MVIPFLGVYMVNHLHFNLEDTGNKLTAEYDENHENQFTKQTNHFALRSFAARAIRFRSNSNKAAGETIRTHGG